MLARRSLGLVGVLCGLVWGCAMPVETDGEAHPLLGQQAPLFTATMLDGSPFDLGQHLGEDVIILDFWATWCGPCRRALPTLVDVAADFRERGVVFFAVDIEETPEQVQQFLDETSLDLTVVMDRDGEISGKYGVSGIPQTVIIGKDGKVQAVHVAAPPDLKIKLSKELNSLLKGDSLVTRIPAPAALASAHHQR